MLGFGAEPHHPFHPGAVVPGAVEKHYLTGAGKMLDIALEVPGGGLPRGGFFQGHSARPPGVEMLIEAFNSAPFAGCIPTFEEDYMALTGVFSPILPFQ